MSWGRVLKFLGFMVKKMCKIALKSVRKMCGSTFKNVQKM